MSKITSTVIVGLDLTEMDEQLLTYIKSMVEVTDQLPTLRFVHNIKYAIDEEIEEALDRPLDVLIAEELREKVERFLPNYKGRLEITVLKESSTIDALEDEVKAHNAHLLVFGKKLFFEGTGITPARLLRQNLCSVLMVPENAPSALNNVLVPIDFSKNSARALSIGDQLHSMVGMKLHIQHIYYISKVYFPFIPVKPVTSGMLKQAQHDYRQFLKKNKLSEAQFPCEFIDGKNHSVVGTIAEQAKATKSDLIIMGTRGDHALFGSVAIGMSRMELKKPILFVR